MNEKMKVCLFNDSFPPTIDGVSNAIMNYASVIDRKFGEAFVATPKYPNVEDDYPFEVLRYRSIGVRHIRPYRAGFPFDYRAQKTIDRWNVDILHSHCPIASTMLARTVREKLNVPLILTYHTKYDIDFRKAIKSNILYETAIKVMIDNVNSCDEVWTVSRGAGENLRSLGFQGDYLVMPNGVDFPKGKAASGKIEKVRARYCLSDNTINLLFVGRIMWYKGIRMMIDALKILKDKGVEARLVFVGDGNDKNDAEEYVRSLGLTQYECQFAGAVTDRELLKAYFSSFDLFLFPSSFDTNGLVVHEAAACSLPSVVLRGSCAAEGMADGMNAILCDGNPASLAECCEKAASDRTTLKAIGDRAADTLYLSWEDSVATAVERYRIVSDKVKSGSLQLKKTDYSKLYYIMSSLNAGGIKLSDWSVNVSEHSVKWYHWVMKHMRRQ